MKENEILLKKRFELYQIYQHQMQMSATIPELSLKNYHARNPANWNKEWQDYLVFLINHLQPLFRLVHGTEHLAEIKKSNEIRAAGDRAQSDCVVWNSNTGGGIARTQWIYFSLRLPPYESVSFIGGGKAKISIDFNKLENPDLFKGMWFAAHVSVFENNGIIAAQTFGTVKRRAYSYREKQTYQKADDQVLCLIAESDTETAAKKYSYSDMIFSAEDGLEKFFENIFRFFIEQLQFCSNNNPFFEELFVLDDEAKLRKTVNLWSLIFQGDSFEICVPGPIPLNLSCIEVDEQRNYFKNTTLLFSLIKQQRSSSVADYVKKHLKTDDEFKALEKLLNGGVSPNLRSISKEPALIMLVKQLAGIWFLPVSNKRQILSLFLEKGADIQVRDEYEKSLLQYLAENCRENELSYFSSLILDGIKRDDGIIEYFNIAMNHNNNILNVVYKSPFFLENISAFAKETPIIANILPFCITKENGSFLKALLAKQVISSTIRNSSGLTPLMSAIEQRLPLELIKMLVSKTTEINAKVSEIFSAENSYAGWTALHFAVYKIRGNEGGKNRFKFLFPNDADDADGNLRENAEQINLIEFLIENNADINMRSQSGHTPEMLLQDLAAKQPAKYSGLKQSISEKLRPDDDTIHCVDPYNTKYFTKRSVLISVLIRVQDTHYSLLIRKPIQYPLFVRSRRVPRHPIGQWWLPGGLSEPNETAIETAARELFEETGFKIAEEDLTEIALAPICFKENYRDPYSEQAYPLHILTQLSLVISNKIIVCDALPLIIAGSDVAVVSWVPCFQGNWQETKHDDFLWRKSNWLLVNEHLRFIIKNDSNNTNEAVFSSSFLKLFTEQLNYEESSSFSALKEVCFKEYIFKPYVFMDDNAYTQFQEDLNNWLDLGGAFNLGNCQELIPHVITALAKRNDYDFYLKLLKYGLDPNVIFSLKGHYFNLISYVLGLHVLLTEQLQPNQKMAEEVQKSLQHNSCNFIQFALRIYQGINGKYLDFSEHSVLSFVCSNNLNHILDQLITFNINLDGYAAGCALVNALYKNHFDMVKRLLPIGNINLNQAYPVQTALEGADSYLIRFFMEDMVSPGASNILQILLTGGVQVIAFIEEIFHFKQTLESQANYAGNAAEAGLLSFINSGMPKHQSLALLDAYCYSQISRTPEVLAEKEKLLRILQTQLAQEISMLDIETILPHTFLSGIPKQLAKTQQDFGNTCEAESSTNTLE